MRRSASGLPPVWQVAQYWSEESAKLTSRTTSPQTGQASPVRPWTRIPARLASLSSAAGLPEAVATASVPATVEGDPDAALTVSLHELRRDGKRLIALVSFVVESAEEDEAYWLYDYLGDEIWSPYLIDPVNLTKHTVLRNGAEQAQTDSQGAEFRPGQTLHGYAMFAAPPEDVTAMDVMLVEGATPATGVEIR